MTIDELDTYLKNMRAQLFVIKRIIVDPKTAREIRMEAAHQNIHYAWGEQLYYKQTAVDVDIKANTVRVVGYPDTELGRILYDETSR